MTPHRRAGGRRDEAGALAVIVAASAVMIFMLAALVVDLGLARDTRRQAQNAADAAALAAGDALYSTGYTPHFDQAIDAVKDYAEQNYGTQAADWATCTDSAPLPYVDGYDGATGCISFDDALQPLEVRVVIPTRKVDTPLGSLAGIDDVSVSAFAQARVKPNAKPLCALCVVGSGGSTGHTLQNGNVTVDGGNIHFNGEVSVGPNGLVATNGSITVEEQASGSDANYQPDPLEGQPEIADPLAFMSMPSDPTLLPKTDPCAPLPIGGPGIYGDFSAGCGTASLAQGLYVITGDWHFSGNESLLAPGVTLYFTCGTSVAPAPCASSGEDGGSLDASGNGVFQISPPTSGPTKGMAIIYDRGNTADFRLTGNGGSSYTGTIYAPSATLDYRGNGTGIMQDTLLVVSSLSFSGGNATLQTTYLGPSNVDLPPGDIHLSK